MEKGWRKRNVIFSEQEATCKWENMRYGRELIRGSLHELSKFLLFIHSNISEA